MLCVQAWSLLTGVKEQYIIQRKEKGKYIATAKYDPKTGEWAQHANSPRGGFQQVWKVPFPEVGGGGTKALTSNQLFYRMCAWDDENYLIAASSKGVSDNNSTNGIVDNHCYTVIECRDDVAGTGIDMIQVRNPWGRQEIEQGLFKDFGEGWEKYPEIKEELQPGKYRTGQARGIFDRYQTSRLLLFFSVFADDGVFWLIKDEFFEYFETIWLGASNMKNFFKD